MHTEANNNTATQRNDIDKTYTKIEAFKNEITIISGIVSCVCGLVMFIISNICDSIIPINTDGIYAVLGFSAACFGIGKITK